MKKLITIFVLGITLLLLIVSTNKNKYSIDELDCSKKLNKSYSDFLNGKQTALFNGKEVYISELAKTGFEKEEIEEYWKDMGEEINNYLCGDYLVNPQNDHLLFTIKNNYLNGSSVLYDIKYDEAGLIICDMFNISYMDSATIYDNNIMSIYHGLSIDPEDKIYDISDGRILQIEDINKGSVVEWNSLPNGLLDSAIGKI